MRRLIVNADDFGLSAAVNAGVVESHEQGLVTSTSLMVRQPAADEAGAYARSRPELSTGLHVDLGEWEYRGGEWRAVYDVVDPGDAEAVEAELAAQLSRFTHLVGRPPTHLDSHQHVHRQEPVRSILRRVGRQADVPVRHESPTVAYRGDFYGQTAKGEPNHCALTVEALVAVLRGLPEGVTELGCHPGHLDPDLLTMYVDERPVEVSVLCDHRVRRAVEEAGIGLISFAGLGYATERPGSASA